MTPEADSFLELATKLRALGAVKVEAHGCSVYFEPRGGAQSLLGALKKASGGEKGGKPAELLTDAELKEQAYQRELGRVGR